MPNNKLLRKEQFNNVITRVWGKVKDNFIKDIAIGDNEQGKKAIKKIRGNGNEEFVAPQIITEWDDLDYTSETHSFLNLLTHEDTKTFKDTGAINADGSVAGGSNWTRIYVPVKRGEAVCLHNKRSDLSGTTNAASIIGSSRITYFNSPNKTFLQTERIDTAQLNNTHMTTMEGKRVLRFIPYTRDENVTHVCFNINQDTPDSFEELMVWIDGQTLPPNLEYVKDHVVDTIVIDGSKVKTTFDPQTNTTQLHSTKIDDAIRELAKRPSGAGTITSVNGDSNSVVRLVPTFNQPLDGNITLRLGDQTGEIQCMTNQEVEEIKRIFN